MQISAPDIFTATIAAEYYASTRHQEDLYLDGWCEGIAFYESAIKNQFIKVSMSEIEKKAYLAKPRDFELVLVKAGSNGLLGVGKRSSIFQVSLKYSCTRCVKNLEGEDLVCAKKRHNDDRLFYKDAHKPGLSRDVSQIWDAQSKIHYCHTCLAVMSDWEDQHKRCITCGSCLGNYVQLPGFGDFYCAARENATIHDPQIESCSQWQLGKMFVGSEKT